MKPAKYLAGIASARGLYLWLFADAQALLPPATQTEGFDLVSLAALKTAAAGLSCTPATVRRDLALLINFRWVQAQPGEPGGPKRLGRREGGVCHLLADLAAEAVTGEKGVVSKLVLGLGPQVVPAASADVVGTGTRRAWGGGGTWTWGGVVHGQGTKDSGADRGPGQPAGGVDSGM